MTIRDWASLGISWLSEPVSEVFGENNQSDKREVAIAQLPVISDIDKLATAGVNVLAWLNASNSLRVRAQAIARAAAGKGFTNEALRERVWQAMLGQRAASGSRTITKLVRMLPDGTSYDGDDETDFRQLFALALVDLGVPGDVATQKAQEATF